MRLHFTRGRRGKDVSASRHPLHSPTQSFPSLPLAVAMVGFFAIKGSAEDPWLLWAKPVHDIASYNYFVDAMASDRQANVCVAGSVTADQGYSSLWFAIYNCQGTENLFGHAPSGQFGADSMSAADVGLDANTNLYLTGWSTPATRYIPQSDRPQGTVMLLTKSGSADVWLREAWNDPSADYSPGSISGMGVAVDDAGNTYVTGAFSGANPNFGKTILGNAGGADNYLFSNGKADGFIVKYDTHGTILWLKHFGGAESDQGDGIGLDAQGNLYISGTVGGPASFDSVTVVNSGRILAKYSVYGDAIWAHNIESGKMKVDQAGNCFVAGTNGLAKYGPDGQLVWQIANRPANALAVSRDNLFALNGTTLSKYTLGGDLVWSSDMNIRTMAADYWGNVYLGDIFQRNSAIGNIALAGSQGYESIYLARLGSETLRLRIARSGGQTTAFWSTNATGFQLVTSANLESTNVWVGVEGKPSVQGNLYTIPLPNTDPARFYRLQGN